MKRIAIIGANGYIARNLIEVLKRDYPDNELLLYGIENESIDGYVNYTAVNMQEKEQVKKIDLSCDIVFMLVGKTGSVNGFDDYDFFIDTNEKTLLNLLAEYRSQKSHARIVFPSTRLVYKGKTGLLNEESEKEFKTIYAINKYACEKYLEMFHQVYNIQYTVLRVCIPYGTLVPGASSYGTADFMLSKAKKRESITLYGDGSVRRSLIYMEDLCKTMINAAITEKCANNTYNIGGENYSLREMAELIAQKYNINIEYIPWPDIPRKIESGDTVFDSQKLDALLGHMNNTTFSGWIKDEEM